MSSPAVPGAAVAEAWLEGVMRESLVQHKTFPFGPWHMGEQDALGNVQ